MMFLPHVFQPIALSLQEDAALLADESHLPVHDLHVASKTSLVGVIFVAKAASIHCRFLKLLCDVT